MSFNSLSRRSLISAATAGSLATVLSSRHSSSAQQSAPAGCSVPTQASPVSSMTAAIEPVEIPSFEVPEGAIQVNMGTLPIAIYAPIYVAYEKGYYAQYGLDVKPSGINSGTDIAVLTATNELQVGLSGIGPAFWNGIDTGLPLKIIAPGHQEGDPVASPLMVARQACNDGTITSVEDLKGKRVSVNAPGATEYWLDAALGTGGLSIEDVDLQYLAFPDAVTALGSGALDAGIIGEPLATQAEQQGILVRLASRFPVQGIQVTAVYANAEWVANNPDAAAGFVAGYLQACRDLMEAPNDPLNLTIINKYTDVPIPLIADSVKPVYQENGDINIGNLVMIQEFFGGRGLLDFDGTIDPNTVVEQQVIDDALVLLDSE
ncbi:MAG TPA: ABC transporter substrate-binding protein [Thermomicrobiales bacterium]|nr:ABC transporter substrate-binding protein [Thermomicrobiales bacterium]